MGEKQFQCACLIVKKNEESRWLQVMEQEEKIK
jgi:hypothetical protein